MASQCLLRQVGIQDIQDTYCLNYSPNQPVGLECAKQFQCVVFRRSLNRISLLQRIELRTACEAVLDTFNVLQNCGTLFVDLIPFP